MEKTHPAAVAALASVHLPLLQELDLKYGVVGSDREPDPSGSAPGLQLITAAPWFPQLRRLEVRWYDEPPGDVSGAAIPLHLTSLMWAPTRRNDTCDTIAALSHVLAGVPGLCMLNLDLPLGPHGQQPLTRAALAALLAAAGPASALEALNLRSGVLDGEAPGGAHPLAALAAAQLPELRSLTIQEAPGASCDFVAALGAAPWAPHLRHLRLSSEEDRYSEALGELPQTRAAAEALAAAPLTSLSLLDFGAWALPLEAMLEIVRAPWFGGLDSICMFGRESERQALCAASPAYAALLERGRAH